MSFTYSGNPATSNVDAVRYLIGDTDESEALVSDEEISFMVTRWMPFYDSIEWVAATVLDTLAGRYAREAQISADGVSITLSGLQQQFSAQAEALRNQYKNLFVGAQVDVGGIDAYEQHNPLVKPFAFGTGMHDNHSAGQQDYGGRDYPTYVPEEQPGV